MPLASADRAPSRPVQLDRLAGALLDPNSPSLGRRSRLLPADPKPPVPVTNLGQYGYALNVGTSPPSLLAAQAHLGKGVSTTTKNGLHRWDGTGALTPINRFATMFSGVGIDATGPKPGTSLQRLTDDTPASTRCTAYSVTCTSTMGSPPPSDDLLIYAFGAASAAGAVLDARPLATQSQSRRAT